VGFCSLDGVSDPAAVAPFACPRCACQVTERFYGPCAECRRELATAFGADQRDVEAAQSEAARFEPAMHVTPNQVATKD